ncbi:nephrin isoform X2 [Orussus abietinus]|uniref:nephrin isoform X2 n=1 Tax=Orussus abietinus TaxID=222816 RepID=UPI0006268E87|nr:nephrin isoform X2 [Orussus abietinus]
MKLTVLFALCLAPFVAGNLTQYFRVKPANSSVLEGGEVTLRCEIDNRAGDVQWVKDGFAYVIEPNGSIVGYPRLRLVGNKSQNIYNLKITNASLTDDGEYQCQVRQYLSNPAIRANARLTVISRPLSVEISNYPDKKKVEVKAGTNHSLECIVRFATPAASIIWYRDHDPIKAGVVSVVPIPIEDDKEKIGQANRKLLKYDTYSNITITPTAQDDKANYICEAVHPAIPVDKPMRTTVRLSVLYPPSQPQIEGYNEGETVRRGQTVDLVCLSRGGNPSAQVVWWKNNEQIKSTYFTEGKTSKNILSFQAKAEDNKARYTCEASNVMSTTPMSVYVDLTVLFAPEGVTISGPTEARANEQVQLTCTTKNSNPVATIRWVIDDRTVENSTSREMPAPEGGWITSSSVNVTISKEARSVVVLCHAFNVQLQENVVGTHTISVIYPPSSLMITGYDGSSSFNAGSIARLSCTATAGNPQPAITWYKNNVKMPGTIRNQDHMVSSDLEFMVNASDNKAEIRCEASNSATVVPMVQVVVLNVNFSPDKVTITRYPEEFRAGQMGRLLCESSSSNPPAVMSLWKSGHLVMSSGNSVPALQNTTKSGLHNGYVSSVELTLQLTENMNNDVYTCEAKNPRTQRAVLDGVTLNILYKPIFTPLDPNELIGMEGEPFVISVQATANPTPITYSWTKDGLPLSSAAKRISARDSTLNITRLERHDSGTYTCEGINKEGTTFYQLNLTVQYPASIVRASTSGTVFLPSSHAKLFCEVDGSPMGDEYITWYRVGSNSELSGRYMTSFSNKTSYLHIKYPSREDIGEYQCNVNNGIGNVTSGPILFITHYKPEMANVALTKKAAANRGANVQLHCKAQGSPLPRFTWLFEGRIISPNTSAHKYDIVQNEITKLFSETTLTINKVTSNDYGKYVCKAENTMGHAEDEVQLDVTSPPDKPTDLEVYNVTHDSVTLVWKRGFDGGLPTSHQIRWRPALDYENRYHYMDVSPGDFKAVVTGLLLGTYYVFSIKAINAKGESSFLPDLVKVQTLREAPPTELTASEINSSYMIVIIIAVFACACLLIATSIVYATLASKKKAQRSGINKSQTTDMYGTSTVTGDTMTGELSSVSDEKNNVSFEANDYVSEGRNPAASTYLIDQGIDFGKNSLEMQVHLHGTLSRCNNHVPSPLSMDSPPQRTTASGTLSASKSSYIGNPSPAPPTDVSFYSVEMDSVRYSGYEGNPSPGPVMGDPGPGAYYPSLGHAGHPGHHGSHGTPSTGTLTRNRTLPRPVPPPDVTVMTAGAKSPVPPTVPPPPATFARAVPTPGHAHGHPLSTFSPTPTYSDIDGHLV